MLLLVVDLCNGLHGYVYANTALVDVDNDVVVATVVDGDVIVDYAIESLLLTVWMLVL
jgi:hypothetical protein